MRSQSRKPTCCTHMHMMPGKSRQAEYAMAITTWSDAGAAPIRGAARVTVFMFNVIHVRGC